MQYLDAILAVDSFTWSVALFLCIISTGFVCSAIGNGLMGVVIFPLLVLGSLASLQAFRILELVFAPDREINVAVSLCMGMILTLVAMLLVTRIVMLLYGLTIRVPVRS